MSLAPSWDAMCLNEPGSITITRVKGAAVIVQGGRIPCLGSKNPPEFTQIRPSRPSTESVRF